MSKTAQFSIRGGTEKGDLLKENQHTVWVRLKNGDIIKRHKTKHKVMIPE
jgi:hypothetical protein